jgi:hypothetical protein
MMYNLRKIFLQSPWHYFGAAVVAIAVCVFRYFTLAEETTALLMWYEMLSVSGMVTVLLGMLLTVAYFGAFDLFGYVFSPGRTGEHKKYRNYADYTRQKEEKRARGGLYFVPYYVIGILLVLIASLIGR